MVAFDMEGCLTRDPTVWEIMHRRNRTWYSHGEPYWQGFLAGEMGYDDFAKRDVSTWKGAPLNLLKKAAEEVQLMGGCGRLLDALNEKGISLVLISNGLMCVARRFQKSFLHIYANRVVEKNGVLTGELLLNVPYNSKAKILTKTIHQLKLEPQQVVAVGDGEADIPMLELAGTGIAVSPSDPRVSAAATHVVEKDCLEECAAIILS